MSLLSVKNLGLPFTRRSHLITMVLVVLLFAILRSLIPTGGSNSMPAYRERSAIAPIQMAPAQYAPSQVSNVRVPARVEAAPRAAPAALEGVASNSFFDAQPRAAAPVQVQPENDGPAPDVLGEILGSADNSAPKAVSNNPQQGRLDYVEKNLGLR